MTMFSERFKTTFNGTRLFLTATFLWVALASTLAVQAQTSDARMPTAIESGIDTNIKPGDDFFGFANGAWFKATEIPAGKARCR